MPIIWRYLLKQYIKVFFLCLLSFIFILLITRLDEIAHFAALGSEGWIILWFALQQIPYLLPVAIPISCLISAIILMQRLSQSHEMTAFRACGLSLREVLAPLLIASFFIAALNFYIVSELATQSHLQTGLTKMELRTINPLLLLHNKHLMRLRGIFSDTLGHSRTGEYAGDSILAIPNKHNSSIHLILAKNLQANSATFQGSQMTLITPTHSNHLPRHDDLLVENIGEMKTSIKDFAQLLQKKVWTLNNDHLRLALLRARIQDLKKEKALREHGDNDRIGLKQVSHHLNRSYAELIRRFSISLAAFTFTLMGASFGMSIGRNPHHRGLIYVIGLAALYIVAFFFAKGAEHQLVLSTLFYLLPQMIIILAALNMLSRLSKGIE
ncbi:hypothetical protein NEOC84_001775|uniref:LptF/LptG family permease n=1 Tax=Neochlamydia sp. AcF84 TaxID=2315858 RepID=UPI00140A99EC|nr:LptF/LptG family permease [Neochlamydia sp. AcF84]NGY95846.1 hypothetical protein [Neochlamydia sp. AcF84]